MSGPRPAENGFAPLTCFNSGCRVQLEFLDVDDESACRLRALGLREGACVSVLQNNDKFVCGVQGCRFGVQRELAMQLFGREAA